jgi:vacuolar-type H+-ATPase subunit H
MSQRIIKILMERDGNTKQEAIDIVNEAKRELNQILNGEFDGDAFEICYEHFGLEPDYLMDLIY